MSLDYSTDNGGLKVRNFFNFNCLKNYNLNLVKYEGFTFH